MKDWIPELLHQYHRDILQEGWPLGKMGLSQRYYNDNTTTRMYLRNE